MKAKFPQFKAVESYEELMKLVKRAMGGKTQRREPSRWARIAFCQPASISGIEP